MNRTLSVPEFSLLKPSDELSAEARMVWEGFVQWRDAQIYFSPSPGQCPYIPLVSDNIAHLEVRFSYPCLGSGEQMWSATVYFKGDAAYRPQPA